MNQVDFYILKEDSRKSVEQIGCRLSEKAAAQDMRIFIYVDDDTRAKQIDELLWTFSEDSFLPHSIQGSVEASESPIVIGTNVPTDKTFNLMINMSGSVAERLDQFDRVAEIVGKSADEKNESRQRFKQYREHGVEPNVHHL